MIIWMIDGNPQEHSSLGMLFSCFYHSNQSQIVINCESQSMNHTVGLQYYVSVCPGWRCSFQVLLWPKI